MQLELILSNPELDIQGDSVDYALQKSIVRSHISGMNFAYVEFPFASEPGRNLPHVRAAFDLDDAIKIIAVLAAAGDTKAIVIENACKFALSIIGNPAISN